MNDHYDLLIVGGGLVGASLSFALAHLPLRIAVIEAKSLAMPHPAPADSRSIALSYGSAKIFSSLNLWSDLFTVSTPIKKIHVSDQGHFGSALFSAEEIAVPAFGYVIPFETINQTLLNHLLPCKTVDIIAPAQITDLTKNASEHWEINLKQGDEHRIITTKLLIAADGNNSFIRQQQNIQVTEKHYPQTAILTKITLKHAHNNIAYERFTKDGAIALLPLNGLHASIVWTLPHAAANKLMLLSNEVFLEQLQNAFGYRLGQFSQVAARHIFPLKMTIAKQQTKPGLLLLGNAAQSLHPIAAQGFNLALKHVAVLAELISTAHHKGKPIDDPELLNNYVKQISKDRQHIINFTHYLTRLFSNNLFPLNALRDSGLVLLDILPTPKKLFARKCMGLSGKLPRLLQDISLD